MNLPLHLQVHAALTRLLGPGGALHTPPGHVQQALSRPTLQQVAAHLDRTLPRGAERGQAAVVTAGPPGAGKSTALADAIPDLHTYRRLDPDQVKEHLLDALDRRGLLDARHNHTLADGKPVRIAELSGWVHTASTAITDQLWLAALRQGQNVIMEGTLTWPPLIDRYTAQLDDAKYLQLHIVDVEAPLSLVLTQARHRWWQGRLSTAGQGGRFVPDALIEALYQPGETSTICSARARELLDKVNTTTGIKAVLRRIDRTEDTTITTVTDSTGRSLTTTVGPIISRGTSCRVCGRPLTAAASVAAGVGPRCASH